MDVLENFKDLFLDVWREGISGINISEIIIALSIFILIVGLLLSQSTNAPSGAEYFPAKVENGKVISGGFKTTN